MFGFIGFIIFLINFSHNVKKGKDISHIYTGVVLDKNTMGIVDTVEININGKYKEPFPILNKNYEFTGFFIVDNNAETYKDTQGFFELYNNYLFGTLIYLVQNGRSETFETRFSGTIHTESMKMNNIVMFPFYFCEDAIDERYLIAPAKNLKEALEVYEQVMGESLAKN